jgi:hypothetical protein
MSESSAQKRPSAPHDLGDAGKRVWRQVWAEVRDGLVLDERERLILREACGVSDDIARLDVLLKSAKDQQAQLRVLSEKRQQRLAFGRLLAQLELDGESARTPLQRRASRAATARWRPHNEETARRQLGYEAPHLRSRRGAGAVARRDCGIG